MRAANAAGADRHRHRTISKKKKERTVRSTVTKSIEGRNTERVATLTFEPWFIFKGGKSTRRLCCTESNTLFSIHRLSLYSLDAFFPVKVLVLRFLFVCLSISSFHSQIFKYFNYDSMDSSCTTEREPNQSDNEHGRLMISTTLCFSLSSYYLRPVFWLVQDKQTHVSCILVLARVFIS